MVTRHSGRWMSIDVLCVVVDTLGATARQTCNVAMNPRANAVSVLLIDDDVELVRLLAQLFTREGIALRSATTGAAGLDG